MTQADFAARLLSDAEFGKNDVKEVFGVDFADELGKGVEGSFDFEGEEFQGFFFLEHGFSGFEGREGAFKRGFVARAGNHDAFGVNVSLPYGFFQSFFQIR